MKRKGCIKRTTATASKKRSSGSSSVSVSRRRASSSLTDLEVQLGKASLRQRPSIDLIPKVMYFEEDARGDSLDAEALANVDCILSQDFFCTPDYITPNDQNVVSGLDCGKGEDVVRCPKSPEKTITASSKQYRQDRRIIINSQSPILFGNEHLESLADVEEDDEARFGKRKTNGLEKPHSYVSQSAVALRCRVMPPPCIENPFLCATSYVDVGSLGNQRAKFPGFFPAVVGGDGLSRYHTDFHEIKQIGSGNFSQVFQVLKRIDGCLYAVKRSTRPLHLDRERRIALMEVQSLAALGPHENIVGYYSSWFENEHLYIQMELCDYSVSMQRPSHLFTEDEALVVLHQIAKALSFIHAGGIAHLDVKPDNIYVKSGVHKLGDFGCATLLDKSLPVEEGDVRYMPHEILNDNYDYLDKADIFSLGASIYELVRGAPLPESGPSFLNLREGKLPLLPGHSLQFQNLLKAMMDPNPVQRPSARGLLNNTIFDKLKNGKEACPSL